MSDLAELLALLKRKLAQHVRIREQVPASQLTTFGLGAPVPPVIQPLGFNSISQLLKLLAEENVSWKILGAGSNVLLPDQPLAYPVLQLGREWNGFAVSESDSTAQTLLELDVPLSPGILDGIL